MPWVHGKSFEQAGTGSVLKLPNWTISFVGALSRISYGALPVRHVPGDLNVWTICRNYGTTPEQMAEAILKDWNAEGRPDPDLAGLWLAKPEIANHPFKG